MQANSNCSGSHDCTKIMSKVMLALDDELSTEEEKAFLTEVERCNHCFSTYKIEKAFKEFLLKKINHRCIPSNMVDNIRAKIKEMALKSA